MGWFKKQEEFRLLDTRTPEGGPIFWVRDARNWDDAKFIHDMLKTTRNRLPKSFTAAMDSPGSNETLQVRFVPHTDGSCHIHMEYASRDTRSLQELASLARRGEPEEDAFPFPQSMKTTGR